MYLCIGLFAFFPCMPGAEPGPAAIPYCEVARPIYWAPADTRRTKQQADRENRKWKRFCGSAAGKAAR